MSFRDSDRVSMHGHTYPWAYEARVNADPSRVLGKIKQVRGGWETDDGKVFPLLSEAGDYYRETRAA